MADFPSNLRFDLNSYRESEDPSVLRTEMERGVPKQRTINTDVLCTMKGVVNFLSEQDIADFDTFYFDTIKRVGWFNIRHPRTRQIISARFPGGKRGELVPVVGGFGVAYRELEMEYLR